MVALTAAEAGASLFGLVKPAAGPMLVLVMPPISLLASRGGLELDGVLSIADLLGWAVPAFPPEVIAPGLESIRALSLADVGSVDM